MAFAPQWTENRGGTTAGLNSGSVRISSFQDRARRRIRKKQRALGDGALRESAGMGGRSVKLKGTVAGATAAADLRTLASKMGNGSDGILQIYDDRVIDGSVTEFRSKPVKGGILNVFEWQATVESESHFWRGTSTTSDTITLTNAVLSGGSGPHTIAGDVETIPTLTVDPTVDMAAVSLRVETNTADQSNLLITGGTINATGVYLDFERGIVATPAGASLAETTTDLGTIDGSIYKMPPGAGLIFSARVTSSTGTFSLAITHTWYPRYGSL